MAERNLFILKQTILDDDLKINDENNEIIESDNFPLHLHRYIFICANICKTLPSESASVSFNRYLKRGFKLYLKPQSNEREHDQVQDLDENNADESFDQEAIALDTSFKYSGSFTSEPLDLIKPGFSHLPLALFKDVPKTLLYERMHSQLEHAHNMVTASYNMFGIMAKKLNSNEFALNCFEHVLGVDENNLNALAEIISLYEELENMDKADACKKKIEEIMKMVKGEVEDIDNIGALSGAICLGDQGIILSKEIFYEENDACEKYEMGIRFLQAALTLAKNNINARQKADWHFEIGHNLQKLSQIDFDNKQPPRLDVFDDSIKAYYYVSKCSPSLMRRAKSWGMLGSIFSKKPRNYRPSFLKEYGLERLYDFPADCYKQAVALLPDNIEILTRHARFVASHVNSWKALRMFNAFIKKPYLNLHWFPLVSRAEIYVRIYKEAFKERQAPDIQYLKNAKEDLIASLELQRAGKEFIKLAEVYEMMAKHHNPRRPDLHLIKEAVESYKMGFHAPDQKSYRAYVYENFAKDLALLGEKEQAVSYLKESVTNTEISHTWKVLMDILFEMYNGNKVTDNLKELAYWMDFGISKFESRTMKRYIDVYCLSHGTLVTDIIHRLHEDGKMSAIKLVDSMEDNGFGDLTANLQNNTTVEAGYFG